MCTFGHLSVLLADSDCDSSTVGQGGAEVISTSTDSSGNLRVTIGCPGTDVTSVLTCVSGEWTGGQISCSGKFKREEHRQRCNAN